MPTELEFKAKIESHAPIRARLRRLGGKFAGKVLETNIHFDTAGQALLHSGCGLRIRTLRALGQDRKKKQLSTITFKGPLRKGAYKSREEIETTIGEYREMIKLLQPLGLGERIRFEKRRESWVLRAGRPARICKVELDEIPILGTFIEIEAPNVATLKNAISKLGLERARPIREAYVGLLARTRKGSAKGQRMAFKFS